MFFKSNYTPTILLYVNELTGTRKSVNHLTTKEFHRFTFTPIKKVSEFASLHGIQIIRNNRILQKCLPGLTNPFTRSITQREFVETFEM